MNGRKTGAFLIVLMLVASLMVPLKAFAGAKRRVAIMPFEYGAVQGSVGTWDVGKGVTSLLTTKLVNDGTYSVIDRQMLDSILKEQNLSVSDRADPSTACKIGKILSVDAIIVGTITQFGFESSSTNVGAPISAASSYIPYVGGLGGFGLGSLSHRKSKCKVAIDAKLIDINTTEILGAVHGFGESKRSGTSLGLVDMESSGFATSIAGEATLQAVEAIGGQLTAIAAKIPDNQSLAAANVEGKIADVTGVQVIVNVGKQNGLQNGDNLQVERPYKTVKDPVTGKVLKELSNTIAVINLKQVDNDSATGDIVKGSGARVGDTVRKVTVDVSAVVIAPVAGDISSSTKMTTTGTVLPASKSPPATTKTAGGK